jgi:hypothetical protein
MNDDLFNDDDFEFDDFDFDEPADNNLAGGLDDDDFSFGDDDSIDLDDIDALSGLDDSDDLRFDEEERSSGPNRTFIILAGLMLLVLLCAIGLIFFLATRPTGPSPEALQATQIAMENEETMVAATEQAIERQTIVAVTQAALEAEQTQTAVALETLIPITQTAEAELTNEAATVVALTEIALSSTPTPLEGGINLMATQTAQVENMTLTAQATMLTLVPDEPTNTPPPAIQPLSHEDAALTATAIAQALRGGIPSPTPDAGAGDETGAGTGTTTQGTPSPRPTQVSELPETGLFDDMASDQGILMALLLGLGLIAVIAVSRTIRVTGNNA